LLQIIAPHAAEELKVLKRNSPARRSSWPPGKRRLRELAEQALIDTNNESEKLTSFFTMIEDHLELPFETEILGVTVNVQHIDLTRRDEIVAICRRGMDRGISLLDARHVTRLPYSLTVITTEQTESRAQKSHLPLVRRAVLAQA
jgi:hypothetical protein